MTIPGGLEVPGTCGDVKAKALRLGSEGRLGVRFGVRVGTQKSEIFACGSPRDAMYLESPAQFPNILGCCEGA